METGLTVELNKDFSGRIKTLIYANMKANIHKSINRHDVSKLLYPKRSYDIHGCVFDVRNQYGPGHKEVVYQRLLKEKLEEKELKVEREKRINVYSQDTGKVVGIYQPDLVVDEIIVLEIKAKRVTIKVDEIQLYHYLRNSVYELGYLINFSAPKLFVKKIVYSNSRKPNIRVD